MRNSRVPMKALSKIATAALVLSAVGTAGPAAAQPEQPDEQPLAQVQTRGVEITQEQADLIEQAVQANPELSASDALDAAGVDETQQRVVEEGYAEATADCSAMSLWGNSDGAYTWKNDFFRLTGGFAVGGNVRIYTDGAFFIPGIRGIEGRSQDISGQMPSSGLFPNGMGAEAWSVNTRLPHLDPAFCYGEVWASFDHSAPQG
ncbi:hypothetical protein IQ251_19025 [Saccharopolyspora sp. HNM0983]|uniref:Porin n=1 Tax=Saccharopolyspora montiporae TaxID=2781240 RepID=A0A929BFE4_9PSEU|nr:hypothetical protein [Saccharopolyspora sp. HNM0983]MBE9376548.1 hypothetical protein [Saccharopolyspora sp. HNM0983]